MNTRKCDCRQSEEKAIEKCTLTNVSFTKEMGQIVPSTDYISTVPEVSNLSTMLSRRQRTYQCRAEHPRRSLSLAASYQPSSIYDFERGEVVMVCGVV